MHLLEALSDVQAMVSDLLNVTNDIDIHQFSLHIGTSLHALRSGLLEDVAHAVDAVLQLQGNREVLTGDMLVQVAADEPEELIDQINIGE